MSTAYFLHCKRCGESMHPPGWTDPIEWVNRPITVGKLIELRGSVSELWRILKRFELADFPAGVELELRVDGSRVNLEWMREHADHELTVRNEYGFEMRPDVPVQLGEAPTPLTEQIIAELRQDAQWSVYTGNCRNGQPVHSRQEAEELNRRFKLGETVRPHNAAARVLELLQAEGKC